MSEKIFWMDFVLNDRLGPVLSEVERTLEKANVMDDASARKSDSVLRTLIQETEQGNEPARMVGDSFSAESMDRTEAESHFSQSSLDQRGATEG